MAGRLDLLGSRCHRTAYTPRPKGPTMRSALLLFVTVTASACGVLNGDDDNDIDLVIEQLSEECYAACNGYHELMW